MEQTWRWYGPDDPVRLSDIRQAGATGIVTSLQDIPIGDVWSLEALQERKRMIEWDDSLSPPRNRGLSWSVVESIPVHEDIKLGLPGRERYIENYKQSIRNVGAIGVKTVCYNFMPVLDWTRTDLEFELEDGSLALRFDVDAFAAFDLFILKRPGAASEYSEERQQAAWEYFEKMTQEQKENLQHNIIAGLPGGQEGYSLAQFQERLNAYRNVDDAALRSNLAYFLQQIVPVVFPEGLQHHFLLIADAGDIQRARLGRPGIGDDVTGDQDSVRVIGPDELRLVSDQMDGWRTAPCWKDSGKNRSG